MSKPAQVVKANEDVIGKTVKNHANEDLGKIKEIVLDKITGQTKYIVLESGSFLGLGGKFFAIPWNSINYNKEKETFNMNVDKERFKNAPGFDKDNWPEMESKYFSTTDTYWKQDGNKPTFRK